MDQALDEPLNGDYRIIHRQAVNIQFFVTNAYLFSIAIAIPISIKKDDRQKYTI